MPTKSAESRWRPASFFASIRSAGAMPTAPSGPGNRPSEPACDRPAVPGRGGDHCRLSSSGRLILVRRISPGRWRARMGISRRPDGRRRRTRPNRPSRTARRDRLSRRHRSHLSARVQHAGMTGEQVYLVRMTIDETSPEISTPSPNPTKAKTSKFGW